MYKIYESRSCYINDISEIDDNLFIMEVEDKDINTSIISLINKKEIDLNMKSYYFRAIHVNPEIDLNIIDYGSYTNFLVYYKY